MNKQLLSLVLICVAFASQSQLYTPGSGVTDIDGNTYQTVIINGQEWMAENLRTTKYANGDPIPNVTDGNQWQNLTSGAWVHWNNDNQYENPYGKLYNWYTVDDPRNVCPTDWHVPSDEEWSTFINYLDPNADGGNNYPNTAGGKMKSTGTQYWQNPNTNATNESGFSGLPGGTRGNDGSFVLIGYFGYWWSSTEHPQIMAGLRHLNFDDEVVEGISIVKEYGLSVRCLKFGTSGINLIEPNHKNLIEVYDFLGNKTLIKTNELQFYKYSDGSIEKKIIIE